MDDLLIKLVVSTRIAFVFLVSLFSALAISAAASAQSIDRRCDDQRPPTQHTPNYGYTFKTDSAVDRGHNGKRDYWACVENAAGPDVRLTWHVPGVDIWLINGQYYPLPRSREDALSIEIDGCLSYGNVGEHTVAKFLGSIAEEALSQIQIENGCVGLRGLTPAEPDAVYRRRLQEAQINTVEIEETLIALNFSFPSDLLNAEETMLTLDGTYEIKPAEENGYETIFSYDLAQAEGRPSGVPSEISISHVFANSAAPMVEVVQGQLGNAPIELAEFSADRPFEPASDQITYTVEGDGRWLLGQIVWQFLDRNNEITAAVTLPAYLPLWWIE